MTDTQPPPQTPHELLPKLFGPLKERYAARQGGYTRVLRTEPKDRYDQAPSAILELVDGPTDMRFAVTAAAVARDRALGRPHTPLTQRSIERVTRFRPDGVAQLEDMVMRTARLRLDAPGAQLDELQNDPWSRGDHVRPQSHKPRHSYTDAGARPRGAKEPLARIRIDSAGEEGDKGSQWAPLKLLNKTR